jgi:hypothetical protein
MKTNKRDIVYGDTDVTLEDLEISKSKVRVNTWIDGDIVLELKKRAEKEHTKYQTLLNSLLRASVFKDGVSLDEILKRINTLEDKVG